MLLEHLYSKSSDIEDSFLSYLLHRQSVVSASLPAYASLFRVVGSKNSGTAQHTAKVQAHFEVRSNSHSIENRSSPIRSLQCKLLGETKIQSRNLNSSNSSQVTLDRAAAYTE